MRVAADAEARVSQNCDSKIGARKILLFWSRRQAAKILFNLFSSVSEMRHPKTDFIVLKKQEYHANFSKLSIGRTLFTARW